VRNLFTEDVEIEVEFLPAPKEECCEGGEHEEAQDPLLLFQAFSVDLLHLILWEEPSWGYCMLVWEASGFRQASVERATAGSSTPDGRSE